LLSRGYFLLYYFAECLGPNSCDLEVKVVSLLSKKAAKPDSRIVAKSLPTPTMTNTVADYRWFTVRLQLKTLLPCILLLTPAIEVIYY
jgi:hypothetical protein